MGFSKTDAFSWSNSFLDLWVPPCENEVSTVELLHRLSVIGYRGVALTHTVFGKLQPDDNVSNALRIPNGVPRGLRVWRRLHAVVESLSDVGYYSRDNADALLGYDIISISPRSEALFSAVCATATAASIITLDYTLHDGAMGTGLPFRLSASDVRVAIERGAVFELSYAPAILNRRARQNLIVLSRELQMLRLHGLRILVSSGVRRHDGTGDDLQAMAVRIPNDVKNVLATVLRLTSKQSTDALSSIPLACIEHSRLGRGAPRVRDVSIEQDDESDPNVSDSKSEELIQKIEHPEPKMKGEDDDFIPL